MGWFFETVWLPYSPRTVTQRSLPESITVRVIVKWQFPTILAIFISYNFSLKKCFFHPHFYTPIHTGFSVTVDSGFLKNSTCYKPSLSFFLTLKLSHIWLLGAPWSLLLGLTDAHHSLYVSFLWGTMKCSRLTCPSSRVSHFSKDSSYLYVRVKPDFKALTNN